SVARPFVPLRARAAGVAALDRLPAVHLPHAVSAAAGAIDGDERGGVAGGAGVFFQPPAAEVMRHAEHPATDALSAPGASHEGADAGADPHEVAGAKTVSRGVGR